MKARLVILLLLVGSALSLWGQVPDTPEILGIRIYTGTGGSESIISWKYETVPNPAFFKIYRYRMDLGVWGQIAEISGVNRFFALNDEEKDSMKNQIQYYLVTAYNGGTDESDNKSFDKSMPSIFIKATLDNCKKGIKLEWNNVYKSPNIKVYKDNGTGYKQVPATDLKSLYLDSCIVTNLTDATTYGFYVELNKGDSLSTSDTIHKQYQEPREPKYMLCETIDARVSDKITVTYLIDTERDLNNFSLISYRNKVYDTLPPKTAEFSSVEFIDEHPGIDTSY
jgi:hypothetical protein